MLGLILRQFNLIVSGFGEQPPLIVPYWGVYQSTLGTLDDAQRWVYGFNEGVKLSQAAAQRLLNDTEAQRFYQRQQRSSVKVGRNEPCPCGSGRKFKKCCGA